MADSEDPTQDFPTELQDRLSNFDESLTEVEEILKPLHGTPINELQSKVYYFTFVLCIIAQRLTLIKCPKGDNHSGPCHVVINQFE